MKGGDNWSRACRFGNPTRRAMSQARHYAIFYWITFIDRLQKESRDRSVTENDECQLMILTF
jgi:hypothetical protein